MGLWSLRSLLSFIRMLPREIAREAGRRTDSGALVDEHLGELGGGEIRDGNGLGLALLNKLLVDLLVVLLLHVLEDLPGDLRGGSKRK